MAVNLSSYLWRGQRQRLIMELADANAVTVSASDAETALSIVEQAFDTFADHRVVRLDLTRMTLTRQIAVDLLRQAVGVVSGDERLGYLGPDQLTSEQLSKVLEARRRFDEAYRVLDGRDVPDSIVIEAALRELAGYTAGHDAKLFLVFICAERGVANAKLSDLMWTVRSVLQRLRGITLVFCGGPFAYDLTRSEKAAFYGWGTEVVLDPPGQEDLSTVVERELRGFPVGAERLADEIADRADGSVVVAEQLTETVLQQILRRDKIDVGAAWDELLHRQAASLRVTANAIAGLYAAAIPVLTSIARNRSHYNTAGVSRAAVGKAVTALHAAGVIRQEAPRRWKLVDPLLRAWLLQPDGASKPV